MALLVFLIVAASPQETEAQSRARFVRWSYQDAGALVKDASAHAPLILGSAGVVAAATRFDPLLLEGTQATSEGLLTTYLDVTNELGNRRVLVVATGLWGVSLATNETRFQNAAFTSLQSLVYAGILTRTLKSVFGRYRPAAESGFRQFEPFSGSTSFPSGHTTAAFALVTPWVLYYPHWMTYGLFALSASTAVARIAKDRHWPTDVVVGGAIGFFVGHYLTRLHQGVQAPLEVISFTPILSPRTVGLRLHLGQIER